MTEVQNLNCIELFLHYKNNVLVTSTEYAAEVYTRSDDKWILSTAKDKGNYIHISAINYDLGLEDIYAQIDEFVKE